MSTPCDSPSLEGAATWRRSSPSRQNPAGCTSRSNEELLHQKKKLHSEDSESSDSDTDVALYFSNPRGRASPRPTELATVVAAALGILHRRRLEMVSRDLAAAIRDADAPCFVNTALYPPSSFTLIPFPEHDSPFQCFASSQCFRWQRSMRTQHGRLFNLSHPYRLRLWRPE